MIDVIKSSKLYFFLDVVIWFVAHNLPMLIQYNYKLYSVTDIVSCLLKNTEVADFSIKDLEIEDVIKEVC